MHSNVFESLNKFYNTTALITDDLHSIDYKDLVEISDDFGRKIPARNVVLLICENGIESIASYVGFIRSGVVPLLIDSSTNETFIENIRKKYNIKYICSPKSYTDNLDERVNVIHTYEEYNIVEFKIGKSDFKIHDDLALLLPTSGSTGSPKFVRISYRNLFSNTRSISESLPINSEDTVITTMPMHYSYGLSIVNTHLFNGASILLTDKTMMEKEFWLLFSKVKITTFGGVPFIYQMLRRLKFPQINFNHLKYITQAGGKLDKSLVKYFISECDNIGVDFYIMYGQTEATARMSLLSPVDMHNTETSIGKAIPGGLFSLIDESGQEIKNSNISGELIYSGDNVSMGYAEGYTDLEQGDLNNGVLSTGDIAKRDVKGFYYIVGRVNRFVKIFGTRTSLDEIEVFLNDQGLNCICSGLDDNLKIYTQDSNAVSRIYEIINKNHLIHNRGYSVILIDSIPRNNTGKVMYSKLQ